MTKEAREALITAEYEQPPQISGIAIGPEGMKVVQRGMGLVGDDVHFSIADPSVMLKTNGINPDNILRMAFRQNRSSFLIPLDGFQLELDEPRPVLSIVYTQNGPILTSAMLIISQKLTHLEAADALGSLRPIGETLQKVENLTLELRGVSPANMPGKNRIPSMEDCITRYSSMLITDYLIEEQIPTIFTAHTEPGEKSYFSTEPREHIRYGVPYLAQRVSPARNIDAFINVMQLAYHLRGEEPPFDSNKLEEIVSKLNQKKRN